MMSYIEVKRILIFHHYIAPFSAGLELLINGALWTWIRDMERVFFGRDCW